MLHVVSYPCVDNFMYKSCLPLSLCVEDVNSLLFLGFHKTFMEQIPCDMYCAVSYVRQSDFRSVCMFFLIDQYTLTVKCLSRATGSSVSEAMLVEVERCCFS